MLLAFAILLTAVAPLSAQGNLLRNAWLQDDWLTLLPELKNHHWNYTTEVYGRRDYNPDGWRLSGNWEWRDADLPPAQRKLVLRGGSKIIQTVNAFTVHDSKKLEGWPDAGGYPAATAVRSKRPEKLLQELNAFLTLAAKDLPEGALEIRAGFSNGSPYDDPLAAKRSHSLAVFAPGGAYERRTVELKLPIATWLDEAKKDPRFAAEGALLPMSFFIEIAHTGSVGEAEIQLAELHPFTKPDSAQLLSFDPDRAPESRGDWSPPQKYRYFPPGIYYIFNTWHNANSQNRGLVRVDSLISFGEEDALQMIVPSGDEVCVTSKPIVLNQQEPRLIQVDVRVKAHQLAMYQIDAEDEQGRRLDGFNFIHKNPQPVRYDEWRTIRQVFRPQTPVKSVRIKLCARGANGYTLDDTGQQPQQNFCGMVWFDRVLVSEPESTADELKARSAYAEYGWGGEDPPRVTELDIGECLLGTNQLVATVSCKDGSQEYRLLWSYGLPGKTPKTVRSEPFKAGQFLSAEVKLPYVIDEPCPDAYTEYRGELRLEKADGTLIAASPLWFGVWTTPIDLELGALYLQPDQKQFVRMNLGISSVEMQKVKAVELAVLRRGTGEVLKTVSILATPADILALRTKIPDGLRDDLRNLVLADLDVSFLPVQPFDKPERNWVVRARVVYHSGKFGPSVTSQPFCRLAHDQPQPPIQSVRIDEHGSVLVNDRPWMPWGVTYGHNPVYAGPADSGKYLDLRNLQQWSLYDRHGGNLASRAEWDINCLRFVEGAQTKEEKLDEMVKQNLYASTVFLKPPAAGQPWPEDYLKMLRGKANVVAVSPGPEEAFGHFAPMTPEQLAKVKQEVDHLRQATGKPVMVGHGGYWTRLELERVPFFDIFDPETEPWYPAPLHTDLAPLIAGQPKAIWLRPQMYESVPYERWRYHVMVELIRGARGWQVAHGPGDASTMRGLHAELQALQPAIYSREAAPQVTIDPPLENLVRRVGNKTTIVAASTHGMSFGNWRWTDDRIEAGRVRESSDPHIYRDESDGYHAAGDPNRQPLVPHGIQYLIHPRRWPAGSKLVTWVKLDENQPPKSLVALVKADGRWTHAAHWGEWKPATIRDDNAAAFWFLRTFYRHARGFLGWGDRAPPYSLAYIPEKSVALGALPPAGKWLQLEVALENIDAADKLLDGVAWMHEGGRVQWVKSVLVDPAGKEFVVFGDREDRVAPEQLEKTTIHVTGLKPGTRVKVLFEDREIVAEEGLFRDDFRGVDLYQRYGGEGTGYGNHPVAVHVYELTN